MGQSLTNLGSQKVDATEETNVTGQRTGIIEWQPKDGLVLEIRNIVAGGVPVYMKLRDSNGDELPRDTEVTVRFDAPRLDSPSVVSEVITNIGVWNRLTLSEQQNEEYERQVTVDLEGRGLRVTDIETVEIAVDSSVQVDWANSQVEIDRQAVNIVSES